MTGARSLHLALGDVCARARHFAELPREEEGADAAAAEEMYGMLGVRGRGRGRG